MVAKKGVGPSFNRKTAVDRRQQLIEAGIACLGKGGMAAFTIDQICRQAGVSRGLINHHFRTKDDLLTCIYADMTEHLVQGETAGEYQPELADIIEASFDETAFNRSNLRAWLAIWGQVGSNPALSDLHRERYGNYKAGITSALRRESGQSGNAVDGDSVARQFIALIDGLWLEYCLHSDGFTLATARSECYRFLQAYGVSINNPSEPQQEG